MNNFTMRNKALFLLALPLFCYVLHAQQVATTDVGQAKIQYLQDPSVDGDTISWATRQINATVQTGETWIPLGVFDDATLHTLVIDTDGSHSNASSGIIEFTHSWGEAKPYVHHIKQCSFNNRFVIYSYKRGGDIGLVMKYICIQPSPKVGYVSVKHFARDGKWIDHVPTDDFYQTLTEDDRITGSIEQHSGRAFANEGIAPGVTINQEATFNGKVSIQNGAELSGEVILTEAQGDISMGAFGASEQSVIVVYYLH